MCRDLMQEQSHIWLFMGLFIDLERKKNLKRKKNIKNNWKILKKLEISVSIQTQLL